MGKYTCHQCGGPVNLRETYKVGREYGAPYSKDIEILCADCYRKILSSYYDAIEDFTDDDEHDIPIDEAAAYYLSSGDPDDTYGYTVEELEEYLKG